MFVYSSVQYPPPLVPPRGEVNAADAFDIGSFDEDDVKGIKVSTVYSKAACAFDITSCAGYVHKD